MHSDTSRIRDFGGVLGYAVAILVATPFVAEMLGTAWKDQGAPYQLVSTVTQVAGVNFDFGVIVPLGFVLALLLLFALDQYKRIQTVLLLLGCAGFLFTLFQMGIWMKLIAWDRYWWGLIFGGVFGLVGLYGAKTPSRGRREFPAAARMLYRVTAIVVLVGLIEYHLAYGGGVSIQRWNFYLTIPLSSILLISVGEFVKYSNKKDIVIIGGGDIMETDFLGGLFAEARDRFDGVPLDPEGDDQSAVFLNRAATASAKGDLPERSDTKTVSFRYTPGGFFSRQIVITANRYEAPTKQDLELIRDQMPGKEGILSDLGRSTKEHLVVLIPDVVTDLFQPDSERMADRLRSADSILMIAPMSDFISEKELSKGDFNDWESLISDSEPHYMEIYPELCRIYSNNSRRAIIVATEAELAMQVYEERETRYPSYRDPAFTSFLKNVVLTSNDTADPRLTCDVLPVDRHTRGDEGEASGFDHLLVELSR